MIIDAHQHFWDLDRSPYAWLSPASFPLDRTIEHADRVEAMAEIPIDAAVLVQSDDTAADTAYMLEVAAQHAYVAGVVGWVPLEQPTEAARMLDGLGTGVVGIRNLIHDRPDPDWVVQPAFLESLGLLAERRLPYDLVAVLPAHLAHVPTLSERHPDLVIVIDHLGKPPIGAESDQPWRSLLAAAAENPNVVGKMSGLYPAVGSMTEWDFRDVQPYWQHALDVFGPDRLMFGSDWPVAELAGGAAKVWQETTALMAGLADHERDAVLGRTADRVYRLGLHDTAEDS